MRYFYNKFLAKPVDGTDASDESQCGENVGLSVCSFPPSKPQKKTGALSGLSHKSCRAL